MDSRKAQNIACAILLAVWIVSFFLLALSDGQDHIPGYKAAGLSALAFGIGVQSLFKKPNADALEMLYLGSFSFANLFMVAAPFALRLARRGRALAFVSLMGIWDILTCSYLIYSHITKHTVFARLGWWTWEASLIAMTVLLLLARENSKHDSAMR